MMRTSSRAEVGTDDGVDNHCGDSLGSHHEARLLEAVQGSTYAKVWYAWSMLRSPRQEPSATGRGNAHGRSSPVRDADNVGLNGSSTALALGDMSS